MVSDETTIEDHITLQPEEIISILQDNRITVIIVVSRLYKVICKGIMDRINQKQTARLLFLGAEKAGSQFLSRTVFSAVHKKFGGNLKYLVCGGAALNPDVEENFTDPG